MPVDFEALADLGNGTEIKAAPTTKGTRFDFEAFADAPQAAANLATHRWRLNRLKASEATDTMPTGGGDKGYGDLTKATPPPATPLTDFENRPRNQGLFSGVEEPPDKGLGSSFTPGDVPNAAARIAANAPGSLWRLGATSVLAPTALALDAPGTIKGIVQYTAQAFKEGGKALAWSSAKALAPGIERLLEGAGIGPDEFLNMAADDPAGLTAALVGGIEAVRRGGGLVRQGIEAAQATRSPSPVPSPGDFDVSPGPGRAPNPEAIAAFDKQNVQAAVERSPAGQENAWRDREWIRHAQQQEALAPTSERLLAQAATGKTIPPSGVEIGPYAKMTEKATNPSVSKDYKLSPREPAPRTASPEVPPTIREGIRFPGEQAIPHDFAVERLMELAAEEKRTARGKGKGKKGTTLGMGLGGAQDFLERRSWPEQRKLITDTVTSWFNKGFSYEQAHEIVDTWKAKDLITGAQESAFKREIGTQHGERLTGGFPAEAESRPPMLGEDAGISELDRAMSEQAQKRKPLSREGEKGTVLGVGGGGLQDMLRKGYLDTSDIKKYAKLVREQGKDYHQQRYPASVDVRVTFSDGTVHEDSVKGLNKGHALARAASNWPTAERIEVVNGLGSTTLGVGLGGAHDRFTKQLKEGVSGLATRLRLPRPEPPSAATGLSTQESHDIAGGGVLENLAAAYGDAQTRDFAKANHFASNAIDQLKNIGDQPFVKTWFGTLPQFFKTAWSRPDVFTGFVRKMGAKDDVKVATTELMNQGIEKILTNPRDRALLGKYLIAENAEAMDPTASVRGVTLSPGEQAQIQGPQFQEALRFYDQRITPELEQWASPAGIKTRRATTNNRYMKLMPVVKEPPRGTWVVDDTGRLSQWTSATAEKWRAGHRGSGITRKTKAGAARKATGAGEYWVADPTMQFENALMDRLPKARHNQMIDVVKSYEVTPDEAKAGVTASGEKVVRVPVNPYIEKADTTPASNEYVAVPKSIADPYLYSVNPWNIPDFPGVSALNRAQVGLMLASPAEAVVHSINVLVALSRQPGIGGKYGPIGRFLAHDPTGVARMIMTLAEVADQSGAPLANNLRRLSREGATRASLFGGEEHGLQKLPGLKQLKGAAFDYPNLDKKGLWGLESRARSAALNLLDKYEPHMTDAQKAAIINNEFGTYVQALQPDLVQLAKKAPLVSDSFAAAGVALTKGAMKALRGKSGRPSTPKNVAEVVWTTWAPAIFTPIILTKILDPKHRWPWEIAGLKAGDVPVVNEKGHMVSVPLRQIAPAFARGGGALGLQDTFDDITHGKLTPEKFAENLLRGAGNTLLSRIGPQGRLIYTALTGKTTHINPSFEMMQVADKSATNQVGANLEAAGKQLGISRDTIASFEDTSRVKNLSPTMQTIQRLLTTIGLGLKIGPGEGISKRLEKRGPVGRIQDTIGDIAAKARNIEDHKARREYINGRLEDIPQSVRGYAKVQILRRMHFPQPTPLTPHESQPATP